MIEFCISDETYKWLREQERLARPLALVAKAETAPPPRVVVLPVPLPPLPPSPEK